MEAYLKGELFMVRVYLPGYRDNEIGCDILYLLVDGLKLDFGIIVDVSFQFGKWDFIEIFKLSIFLSFFLDGIVGEVYQFIIQIFKGVLFAGGSDVTLLVPISFDDSIDAGDQDVASDVEFSLVVKKRVLHVFLDDECPSVSTFLRK